MVFYHRFFQREQKYEVFSIYKIKNEDYYITTEFKDKEFEEIDAAVEQVVMDALKISQQAKRNPEKYRPYQVRLLNEKIYGEEHYTGYNARTGKSTMGDNGLLLAYTRYTESYMDVAKNGGDEWDRRSLRTTAKEIWEMIKNIQRIINTYK